MRNYDDKFVEEIMKEKVNLLNKIADLEAKLAESEVIIKGGKEEIKDLHRKINEIVERDMNCIQQLKQQLAEKDIEIERLKQNYDEVWEDTYFSVKEDFELNNNCNECRKCYAEEFNKQLIAELEKLKDKTDSLMFKINNMNYFIMVKEEIYDFIDQQIKSLKGEK